LANSFIRRRIGSLTFAGFFTRGIVPPLLLVISVAKLQIKAETEEQIRNKNAPKKSQATITKQNK